MSDFINSKPIVMVVDDTPANLRLLAQMLSQVGYDVRVANSGAAALRAAKTITPDLILLDVMMPEMDGYQTCQELKSYDKTKDIPILFISALDQLDAKMRGFSMGGADYITKPFQVEEVLARVKTHLALRSLQRQLERANRELHKQVIVLQKQNEELDAYAHTVAHDLKNPLNNIMGYAELLLRRTKLDEQTVDEITHSIYEGGVKMNDIIDSLLLLAGVRKQVVELGPVDMALVVDEVLRREQFEIEQAQARIIMPESWPKTIGYAPWVELVWINYISNAIKYGGEPPRVELEAVPFSDGRMVRFQVTDNGAGLSAEEMTQLFKPFVRLQKERASGHGLGLTIVDRIATRLGGTVGVESMRGRGSTFYFTLPAA